MNADEIRTRLRETLDDVRLTRSERKALTAVLADLDPAPADLAAYRTVAFELARETLDPTNADDVFGWLEAVNTLLANAAATGAELPRVDCWFSPDPAFGRRIAGFVGRCKRTVDVCIFNLTHDEISDAIAAAHHRGVRVRLLTDDETRHNRGSDVASLVAAGLDVRFDASDAHMHHKFALFDGETLLTGSSNWTRAAETRNRDNFVVTNDVRLVGQFADYFESLWTEFAGNTT